MKLLIICTQLVLVVVWANVGIFFYGNIYTQQLPEELITRYDIIFGVSSFFILMFIGALSSIPNNGKDDTVK